MQVERIAEIIEKAYAEVAAEPGAWAMISRVWRAPIMERYDLSRQDLEDGCLYMVRNYEDFTCAPESNQKALTQEHRDAAVRIGGQWNHIICFDPGMRAIRFGRAA